jgi:ATP-dependent Lon protease
MYRLAEVRVLEAASDPVQQKLSVLGQQVRKQFISLCQRDAAMDMESIQCLLEDNLQLEQLIDMIAFSLNTTPAIKQSILDAEELATRLEIVSRQLHRQLNQEPTAQSLFAFPPCFSTN